MMFNKRFPPPKCMLWPSNVILGGAFDTTLEIDISLAFNVILFGAFCKAEFDIVLCLEHYVVVKNIFANFCTIQLEYAMFNNMKTRVTIVIERVRGVYNIVQKSRPFKSPR